MNWRKYFDKLNVYKELRGKTVSLIEISQEQFG